ALDIFRHSSRPLDATPPLVSHTIAEPAPSLAVPDTDTLRHWLALLHAPGVGAIRFLRILEHEPDLPRFFENRGTSCNALSIPPKLRRYLAKPNWQAADAALAWAEDRHCYIIGLLDPRYPALLKEIPDPPPILFVRGDIDLLTQPQLAMVGSRNPSASGSQLAHDFATALSRHGLTITSGLALGIDAASHQGALNADGKTIAVAGTGLDRIYPARHRELGYHIAEQGALISEFPLGTPPIASNFPRRNRIISGLSLGTLVIEAALKSGSLITARLAAEQGREVFAIPGSIHNPLARGCHMLIQQGAKLTMETSDILEELAPLASFVLEHENTPANATPASELVFSDHSFLEKMGFEPISIDALVERSGLTAEAVSSMLLTLEIQGIVASSGGLYSRI
ncbi:Rossmann fold nucleotide-binding protein Smf possibly involved in DNA uptake, partial [hydrothermal vent metagenome]